MVYSRVSDRIAKLSEDADLSFGEATAELRTWVFDFDRETLIRHLYRAGAIPERFGHDSSEEKLYARYCDILLAAAWRALGLQADLIQARGDAADVAGKADTYNIVGDAKAFRLSRSAHNPKDYKVEALHQWKEGARYASLVCPRYQYPSTRSQIYRQAIEYDVNFFSYVHLAFLVAHPPEAGADFTNIWEATWDLPLDKSADPYWNTLDAAVVDVSEGNQRDWEAVREQSAEALPEVLERQVAYWEGQKERVRRLPHEEAVEQLIKEKKIDKRIRRIKGNLPS